MMIKINPLYLFIIVIYLFFCLKSTNSEPDYYQSQNYLSYNICTCSEIKQKTLFSNWGQGQKKAETDGLTFDKNELTYVGTVYFRFDVGHPQDYRGPLSTYIPLCKGILINTKWALTTAACAKTFDDYYFAPSDEDNYQFGVASNHDLDEYHLTHDEFLLEIASAKFHPEYNPQTGHGNLALLELFPAKFGLHYKYGINLFAGCLQDIENDKLNSLDYNNYFFTMVNDLTEKYRREYDWKHRDDPTDNKILAENLKPKLIKVKIRDFNTAGDSRCTDEFFCTDSKYKGLFCPTDNGSPLLYFNSKYFKLEIIGLNDSPINSVDVKTAQIIGDNNCTKHNVHRPVTFIKIYPYLKWIIDVTQKICLTPELIRKKHRYCDCQNTHFKIEGEAPKKYRIINGQVVMKGDFEYVGYFAGSTGVIGQSDYTVKMFCTTVLLNRMFSLTTAACIKDKDDLRKLQFGLWVAYGGNHVKEVIETLYEHWRYAKHFHVHPNYRTAKLNGLPYNGISYNDIGLIEHEKPFDYGHENLFIHPACLQDFNPFRSQTVARSEIETFKFSYALGYGHLHEVMQKAPEEIKGDFRMLDGDEDGYAETYLDGSSNKLMRTKLQYFGNEEECGESYKGNKVFCFKKAFGKICKPLDLGGPLMRYEARNRKFYVDGIAFQQDDHNYNDTHWKPCTDDAMMRYSNVYDHLDFIIKYTGYDMCWTSGPYDKVFQAI